MPANDLSSAPLAPEHPTGSTGPRVAIQGYSGAFHEIAARRYFGAGQFQLCPAHTFPQLVDMVCKTDEADIGLMAIENSLAGSINHNYALLRDQPLRITGEVYLRIEQNLLTLPGTTLADLREVHSHPMAIAQCRRFFSNYPHIQLVETADTALSARQVATEQQLHVGAIASGLAAEMYALQILAPGIETNKNNHTRFLVLEPGRYTLSADPLSPTANKVSLSFATDHAVGRLHQVLAVLAAYGVNLTKIQSMPIVGKPWEYHFYLDFVTGQAVSWPQAIRAIEPITHELTILGAYTEGEKHLTA